MIQRALSGWTFIRAFYLLTGVAVIVQSVMEAQWFGLILGGYFSSMAVFNYGCAAGNCSVNYAEPKKQAVPVEDITYEEIKK